MQYTIRVYGEAEKKGDDSDAGTGPGTQWLSVKLRARRVPEIAPVTGATTSFVRATRAERHDHPPLVASVYHLVPKTKTRAYRTALARASTELTRVELRMTGPWPPYAFAELP